MTTFVPDLKHMSTRIPDMRYMPYRSIVTVLTYSIGDFKVVVPLPEEVLIPVRGSYESVQAIMIGL